jgi:hypothetical protein
MFDPTTLIILGLSMILAGGLLWVWYRSPTDTDAGVPEPEVTEPSVAPVVTAEPATPAVAEKPTKKAARKPRANSAELSHPAGEVTPTVKVAKPSSRVKALKSADAVTTTVTPVLVPPTKTEMERMTKADLETTARQFGIELDRRLTKAGMTTAFIAQLKAQAK